MEPLGSAVKRLLSPEAISHGLIDIFTSESREVTLPHFPKAKDEYGQKDEEENPHQYSELVSSELDTKDFEHVGSLPSM